MSKSILHITQDFTLEAEKEFTPLDYFVFLLLVMSFPLGLILPVEIGWENHILEVSQVIILLIGAGICCSFAQGSLKNMWYSLAGIYCLVAGRELSWGRVFFPTGEVTEAGPQFIPMHVVPYHQFIYLLIFLAMLVILFNLWKYVNLKLISQVKVPMVSLGLCLLAIFVQWLGEHANLPGYSKPQGEVVEELAEVACYLEGLWCSWYYGKELKKLQ